jgi:AbrB family looped-hinge helix DNA binding protein
MSTSNVTQKGQVTIPAEMRKALGLRAGSKVRFKRQGRRVSLEPVEEPAVESLFGTLKVPKARGIADIDAALDDLRQERLPRTLTKRRGGGA